MKSSKASAINDPALPMTYPSFVLRVLQKDGYDPEDLLADTGLQVESLNNPDFRAGFPSIRKFYLNAIKLTKDQHLGIRIAKRFEPTYVGLPAYTAMNAASFQDALLVLNRFFFLSFPGIEFRFPDADAHLDKSEAAVRIRPRFPLGDIAYFGTSSALIGCDILFQGIVRAPGVSTRGELTISEPSGWKEIAGRMAFPIRFRSDENRLIFPSAVLNQLLPGADPLNHRRLLGLCEKLAMDAECGRTVTVRVLSFLEKDGNLGAPLSVAAGLLGYSERSLRREFEKTGTSYRLLVEQVRERRARQLLAGGTLSIQAIAHGLGYETSSNFARSFKRWTGVTPSDYRAARDTMG
jgi:AraC-like DNA-binding protein